MKEERGDHGVEAATGAGHLLELHASVASPRPLTGGEDGSEIRRTEARA